MSIRNHHDRTLISVCPANVILGAAASFYVGMIGMAQASSLPGTVDAGRIHVEEYVPKKERTIAQGAGIREEERKYLAAPRGAEKESFVLQGIRLDGVSRYAPEEIREIYRQDVGKRIPLTRLWEIANAITRKYRDDGYFLSRAYIPAQEIGSEPKISVVEGYISEVDFDAEILQMERLGIDRKIKELSEKKPVRLQDVESFLLLLNDLPGQEFSSVLGLSSVQPKGEGAVRLSITPSEEKQYSAEAAISNTGSKYLGPVVVALDGRAVTLPLQETNVSLSLSSDRREVKAASLSHKFPLTLEDSLVFALERSLSIPGDDLREQDIISTSNSASLYWNHNLYKTRKLDVSSRVGVSVLRSKGEIADTLLSQDDIRKMTIGTSLIGGNSRTSYVFDLSLVKGLSILGASTKNDLNLSRPSSGSDFQKLESSLQVHYWLGSEWLMNFRFQGQVASRSLPSSEEFGFGGPRMGRGYDGSELTGDHGIASSLELAYAGYRIASGVSIRPYIFYDTGKVWNINDGQSSNISASSGGLGVSGAMSSGWRADTYVAKPLTKDIENPQQGGGDSLQIRFQLSKQF